MATVIKKGSLKKLIGEILFFKNSCVNVSGQRVLRDNIPGELYPNFNALTLKLQKHMKVGFVPVSEPDTEPKSDKVLWLKMDESKSAPKDMIVKYEKHDDEGEVELTDDEKKMLLLLLEDRKSQFSKATEPTLVEALKELDTILNSYKL